MSRDIVENLRGLVDWLATRQVAEISLQEQDFSLSITLRPHPLTATSAAPEGPPVIVRARGPGIFLHHPPESMAPFPCLAAGGFLFPASISSQPGDIHLVSEGARVDYGTPLTHRPAVHERIAR